MPRYFVEFSYDGSNYHGLQKQPNLLTIQETIEINMNKYLGINSNLTLAGRTDTGVHAKQMFAHFDIDLEFQQDNFCRSMNKMLPKDITIESLSLVTMSLMLDLTLHLELMNILLIQKKIHLIISFHIILSII